MNVPNLNLAPDFVVSLDMVLSTKVIAAEILSPSAYVYLVTLPSGKFRESPNSTTPSFTPFFTDISVTLDSLQSDVTSPPSVVPSSSPESVSPSESHAHAPTISSNNSDQHQSSVPSSQPTSEVHAKSFDPGTSQSQNVHRSDRVRQVPSHLRDYHVYATLLSNHEPLPTRTPLLILIGRSYR